jgi:hypothetical protein
VGENALLRERNDHLEERLEEWHSSYNELREESWELRDELLVARGREAALRKVIVNAVDKTKIAKGAY